MYTLAKYPVARHSQSILQLQHIHTPWKIKCVLSRYFLRFSSNTTFKRIQNSYSRCVVSKDELKNIYSYLQQDLGMTNLMVQMYLFERCLFFAFSVLILLLLFVFLFLFCFCYLCFYIFFQPLGSEPAIKANHINPAFIGDVGDMIISTMNAALILPPHEPQVKKQE